MVPTVKDAFASSGIYARVRAIRIIPERSSSSRASFWSGRVEPSVGVRPGDPLADDSDAVQGD